MNRTKCLYISLTFCALAIFCVGCDNDRISDNFISPLSTLRNLTGETNAFHSAPSNSIKSTSTPAPSNSIKPTSTPSIEPSSINVRFLSVKNGEHIFYCEENKLFSCDLMMSNKTQVFKSTGSIRQFFFGPYNDIYYTIEETADGVHETSLWCYKNKTQYLIQKNIDEVYFANNQMLYYGQLLPIDEYSYDILLSSYNLIHGNNMLVKNINQVYSVIAYNGSIFFNKSKDNEFYSMDLNTMNESYIFPNQTFYYNGKFVYLEETKISTNISVYNCNAKRIEKYVINKFFLFVNDVFIIDDIIYIIDVDYNISKSYLYMYNISDRTLEKKEINGIYENHITDNCEEKIYIVTNQNIDPINEVWEFCIEDSSLRKIKEYDKFKTNTGSIDSIQIAGNFLIGYGITKEFLDYYNDSDEQDYIENYTLCFCIDMNK